MGSVSLTARVKQIAKNGDLRGDSTQSKGNTPLEDKTPLQAKIGRLQGEADKVARLRDLYKAVLSEYSENRRRAGSLRVEIAKGSKDGDDLEALLEKSLKCIECMTGDKAFYNSVMDNIKSRRT